MELLGLIVLVIIVSGIIARASVCRCETPPRQTPRTAPLHPEERREYEIKVGDAEAKAAYRSLFPEYQAAKQDFHRVGAWVRKNDARYLVAVPRNWIRGERIVLPEGNLPPPRPQTFMTAHGDIFYQNMVKDIHRYRNKVHTVLEARQNPPDDLVWLDVARYHTMSVVGGASDAFPE